LSTKNCKSCIYLVGIANSREILVCTNNAAAKGLLYLVKSSDRPCRNFQTTQVIDRPTVIQPENSVVRFIPLTKGKFAIVDAADFVWLSRFKWHCVINNKRAYAYHSFDDKNMGMHRVIMNPPPGLVVDHIDGNGLNNTRANLRICTSAQNICNCKGRSKTSKYKGVSWSKRNKWASVISLNLKRIHIGYFDDEIEAAKAYDKKAKELFGEFAYLNFPTEQSPERK
jgi:hypothetical protein